MTKIITSEILVIASRDLQEEILYELEVADAEVNIEELINDGKESAK